MIPLPPSPQEGFMVDMKSFNAGNTKLERVVDVVSVHPNEKKSYPDFQEILYVHIQLCPAHWGRGILSLYAKHISIHEIWWLETPNNEDYSGI